MRALFSYLGVHRIANCVGYSNYKPFFLMLVSERESRERERVNAFFILKWLYERDKVERGSAARDRERQ
jgi:hypothetical protein